MLFLTNEKKINRYTLRHGFKSKSKIIQLCIKTELYLHKNKRHNKRPWGKEATMVLCSKYHKFCVFNPWIQVQSNSHSSIRQISYFEAITQSFTRKKVLPNNNDLRKSECRTWTAALYRLASIQLSFTILCTWMIQFKNNQEIIKMNSIHNTLIK